MGEVARVSRYANTGLHAAETLFLGSHERAAQYLDQAPILVMWALPWVAHANDSAPTFARTWIAGHCETGVGLKDFLRAAGFTAPMRTIPASVILPSHAGLYRMLARMPLPVLGRCVPQKKKALRGWLRSLDAWLASAGRRARPIAGIDRVFQWCVERFADAEMTPAQARDLLDFQFVGGAAFNPAWSLKRAREEMGLWHARITLESQLRGLPVGADDTIDLGDQPDVWNVERFTITALRTPRQIADEGSAMRHCVATYIGRVLNGVSHIASITEDGKRVATVDLAGPKAGGKRWRLLQIKGPRNTPVRPVVESMGRLYAEVMQNRAGIPPAQPPIRPEPR